VLLSPWRCFMLLPSIFALRFHSRRFYWRLAGHCLKQFVKGEGVESGFVAEQVLPYNLGNINITNRGRTERVCALLRSIWDSCTGDARRRYPDRLPDWQGRRTSMLHRTCRA
jgi:hypothetical protein